MMLSALSDQKKKTRGELIRQAIRKYWEGNKNKSRSRILKTIDEVALKVDTKGIDYRGLVESGRRY